jgi:hypothetical protein
VFVVEEKFGIEFRTAGSCAFVAGWLGPLQKDFSLSSPNVAGNLQNFRSDYFRIAETTFQTKLLFGNIRRKLKVGLIFKG